MDRFCRLFSKVSQLARDNWLTVSLILFYLGVSWLMCNLHSWDRDVTFRQITTDNAFLKLRVMQAEDRIRELQRHSCPVPDSTAVCYEPEPLVEDRLRMIEARQGLLMAFYNMHERTVIEDRRYSELYLDREVTKVE